jgi:hypothetical protein
MGAGSLDMVVGQRHGQRLDLRTVRPWAPSSPRELATGGAPNQVVIADVDGDGKQDLVLADFNGNVIVLTRMRRTRGSSQRPC